METDIHMLTADNDNQNTCETLINNVNKLMKNVSVNPILIFILLNFLEFGGNH